MLKHACYQLKERKVKMSKKIDYQRLQHNYDTYVWAFGEKAPKEDLEYLYCELELTQDEIAEIIHKGGSTVARWLDFYKIRKPATKVDAPVLTEEMLGEIDWSRMSRNFIEQPWRNSDVPQHDDFYYLYIELNWSAKDIAQLLGRSRSAVQRILDKLGISKPSHLAQQSREKMNLRSTGTRFPNASKEALEKKKQTNLERFGVTSLLKLQDVKEQGMIKKYGKAHPQQVDFIQDKTRKTFNKNCGKDYYFQTDKFKEENKEILLEKYGVDNYAKTDEFKEKMNDVLDEYGKQYGTTFTAMSQIPHIKEKAKQTNMERYGVDHAMKLPEIQKRQGDALEKKYGVRNPRQIEGTNEKILNTLRERYGVTGTAQLHIKHKEDMNKDFWLVSFIDKRSGAFDVAKCAQYHGIRDGAVLTWKRKLGINIRNKGGSVIEGDISGLLAQWGIATETKNRKLLRSYNKEVDIYAPEYKIGIEYDGLLFHSQGRRDYGRVRNHDIDHIQKKYYAATENGIKLFNIFESEWRDPAQNRVWQAILKRAFGLLPSVSLDECMIIELDTDIADDFFEENSLAPYEHSEISLGLFGNDTLYAVAQFQPRNLTSGTWDVVRFTINNEYNVAGALSELIKAFVVKAPGISEVSAYADLRYDDLNQFNQTVLSFVRNTDPYGYLFKTIAGGRVKDLTLTPLSYYTPVTAEEELYNYDRKLTVVENFYEHDYRTIYDCGRAVYKYTVGKQV